MDLVVLAGVSVPRRAVSTCSRCGRWALGREQKLVSPVPRNPSSLSQKQRSAHLLTRVPP